MSRTGFLRLSLLVGLIVLGCGGADRKGACYYASQCIGCGPGLSTIWVRYCYNNTTEYACRNGRGHSSPELAEGACCSPANCDTVLNPESCASR
jgi:hypothetical protein